MLQSARLIVSIPLCSDLYYVDGVKNLKCQKRVTFSGLNLIYYCSNGVNVHVPVECIVSGDNKVETGDSGDSLNAKGSWLDSLLLVYCFENATYPLSAMSGYF